MMVTMRDDEYQRPRMMMMDKDKDQGQEEGGPTPSDPTDPLSWIKSAFTPGGPTEPGAQYLPLASALHQLFTALVRQGFKPEQALQLTSTLLAELLRGQRG